MANYVAIENGKVVNVLEASTKKIAEAASGFPCVNYDYTFHPMIGDLYDPIDGFSRIIIDEAIVDEA